MAQIEVKDSESRNMTRTITVDGTMTVSMSGRIDDSRAGNSNITVNVMNESLYQPNKAGIREKIDAFVTEVLDLAQEQEWVDTATTTTESGPVEDTTEEVATTKASSKKSK